MKIITVTLTVILLFNFAFIQCLGAQSLQQVFNSRVVSAGRYERPYDITAPQATKSALIKHCGVVVNLENGEPWLVQKGDEYGKKSGTVAVPVNEMSSAWSQREFKTIRASTVGDYLEAGGPNYNFVSDNSKHACDRMMQLL